MKVHNFSLTYKRGINWSGQDGQRLEWPDIMHAFMQRLKIKIAIQGKTGKIESLGAVSPDSEK